MLEQPTTGVEPELDLLEDQKVDEEPLPRPALPWWGHAGRIAVISAMILIIYYNLNLGLQYNDSFVIYSTLMPTHLLIVFAVSWYLYKGAPLGEVDNELVSVIIPIYNQESMIESVIEAVYESTYRNLEIIAVNDGSKDGTGEILYELSLTHHNLRVIQKENGGKRTAVATGFYASRGRYIVLMDSDSILDRHAIKEIVKTFSANPRAGGVVGNGKVWNSKRNILTTCQSAWYDYSFNIHKKCESYFGSVLCCSGCLAAYRREAIEDYIPYWNDAKAQYSDDRELTTYAIAAPWAKMELAPIPKMLMESMSKYDDSEDRGLTANTLISWQTLYVPTAVVHTEVPDTIKKFLRQQLRWKKGYIRTNFFVSAFFWRKNPLMALLYYLEFMTTFTSPLITFIVLFYGPFVLHEYTLPLTFIAGQVLVGLAASMDRKARERDSEHWIINPLWNIFLSLVLTWILIPAVLTFREKKWLTR